MWRIKQPYNVSVAAESAALAAINDSEYYKVRSKLNAFILLILIQEG
jgi:histidinol-phosphate/aromatic aminotransferase/cobyric acid decarboxylase-like protein|tara:strand:+ start:244 stop:384 length:141 start_codon:yes stop_codon:yes gene_type:complete